MQEFEKIMKDIKDKLDIICIQETWLRPHLEFVIAGYNSVRYVGANESAVSHLIKVEDKILQINQCILTDIYRKQDSVKIVNFYNTRHTITALVFKEIIGEV